MTAEFWDKAAILIFFVYGLAFYSLGLALLVESGRSSELSFARSMRLLAAFGLLHGLHEWIDMLEKTGEIYFNLTIPDVVLWFRLTVLITSFIALVAFGEHLFAREQTGTNPTWALTISTIILFMGSSIVVPILYNITDQQWRVALDVLARYTLCIPGALIATRALWYQRSAFIHQRMTDFVSSLNWAIGALFIYGTVGQIFTADSVIFPSNVINSELFLSVTGFPIQMARAILACIIAVAMIRVLRALDFENTQRLEKINEEKRKSEHERVETLAQLNSQLQHNAETRERWLQQITAAQEAERQRIARELHDDTGQVLTGLAMALRGLSKVAEQNPTMTAARLGDLEHMATDALGNLRRLISDLRPPQLDDMGIVSALRSMQERIQETWEQKICIRFIVTGDPYPLTKEVEITLFRIAQEAVTNALKHSKSNSLTIELDYRSCLELVITDDGCGFEIEKTLIEGNGRSAWGIYGMRERANLINADLCIESKPDEGTRLTVKMRETTCEEFYQ